MSANQDLTGSPSHENGAERFTPADSQGSPDLRRCLSLDLELGRNSRIRALAGVRPDTGECLTVPTAGRGLAAALVKLDDLAKGADFLLGHNLIAFDLPHLQTANPGLRLLRLPAVDTLRLNPLAFPRNPYHHLVKHYQDGQLKRGRINDPELDARLTLEVFDNQQNVLRDAPSDLLAAWHWLTTKDGGAGFDRVFAALRHSRRPTDHEARRAIHARLAGHGCRTNAREVVASAARHGWSLAFALAWLSVSGSNSVMPPWVRLQFPEAGRLVRKLRDEACVDAACEWCRERHDARKELARWFPSFAGFRPEPMDEAGRPMQQSIAEAAMAGEHVLAVLPTGSGKSICYQVPALSRYEKTGALTVVISPLVALMADQVAGLEARGIGSCVTINSLLSMPERADALDRVRLGDAGILIISPEQLRSVAVRRVLDQREIGAWVLDEAHCLSKWGHDFRPDYLYVGRFIRERAGDAPAPSVLCLTATAKPDVMAEVVDYFRRELEIELKVFDGGAQRTNLDFVVVPTSVEGKFAHIHQIIEADLPTDERSGAIVYCATRRQTEQIAEFLVAKGLEADHFHAGLTPETKKNVQRSFTRGELRVIVATNAFGMGIDKPDVRLVVHADIPGSLENYLQEAGRAGRDQQTARCVLLYTMDDVERQFGMSARSRLTRREIHGVLRALRNLDRKKRLQGEVVATSGEILTEDEDRAFERDSTTDDTRVRTAVSWLEQVELLTREENRVQVFPASLRVNSVKDARAKLEKAGMTDAYRRQLLTISEALIEADADDGISTDELMAASGLTSEGVRKALHDMEQLGIASNDTVLTAFVHAAVERSSRKRLEEASALEKALIDLLRETDPDMGKGGTSTLHLRIATQRLKDEGHKYALPELLRRIVRSIAADGRGEGGGGGSLGVRGRDGETLQLILQREWKALDRLAELRRAAAGRLLDHLLDSLPPASRGTDLLAETTLGKLLTAIRSDMTLRSAVKDDAMTRLMDRALLWLHEQEVIRLNKGLTVFRPAMTIRLKPERRGFAQADFASLKIHYDEQIRQIHVMAEYVQQGLGSMANALRLALDYFTLPEEHFLRRWLPDRDTETSRQTTPESWRTIVESLNNPVQRRIVADDREQTNVLVLAGPGSGKTRVLVHRVAYLIRVRRENPHGILALAYNRHAAVEIRRRLAELIGDDARGVIVLTCHALAMRLVGASFTGRANRLDDSDFQEILRQAVALLRGEGLPPDEADEYRTRLLAGFRWILVDEYQDIGPAEYGLISALAGRTLPDEDDRISLFAVGDDDQNIYTFNGSSVEFIRRFERDYGAKPFYLTGNYRSTAHIVASANTVIEPSRQRMKAGYPIHVDRAREKDRPGGVWTDKDPVAQGRGPDAAGRRYHYLTGAGRRRRVEAAVLSRSGLDLVCLCGGGARMELPGPGAESLPARGHSGADGERRLFWRLASSGDPGARGLGTPTRFLLHKERGSQRLAGWATRRPLDRAAAGSHRRVQAGVRWRGNIGDHFIEWLAEWARDVRRRQRGLLLLTAHRAKGLEFDHVVVLDGNWDQFGGDEDEDAPRRLYYVAMTRARETLTLARLPGQNRLQDALRGNTSVCHREPLPLPPPAPELARRYRRLSLRDVFLSFAGYKRPDDPSIAPLVRSRPVIRCRYGPD